MKSVMMTGLVALGLMVLGSIASSQRADSEGAVDVDLLLVLAVDASESVNTQEYELQVKGIADAILDQEVMAAITGGPFGRIAVAVLVWADVVGQKVAVPWTVISDPASARVFSQSVRGMGRPVSGSTSLAGAISSSIRLLDQSPYRAFLRKIDISGDGRNNNGGRPDWWRDRAAELGITINGLAIVNEERYLADYYQNHVITGPASFVSVANDYWVFREVMRAKLVREITAPIS